MPNVSEKTFQNTPCGTHRKYQYSCRCNECTQAQRHYQAIEGMAGRAALRWMKENRPRLHARIIEDAELRRAGKSAPAIKVGSEVVHIDPKFEVLGKGKVTSKSNDEVRVKWEQGMAGWIGMDSVRPAPTE